MCWYMGTFIHRIQSVNKHMYPIVPLDVIEDQTIVKSCFSLEKVSSLLLFSKISTTSKLLERSFENARQMTSRSKVLK